MGDFFGVLGIEPAIGRKFLPEEMEAGKNRVVILSHALWQRRFGGYPKIVGQQILIRGNAHTVVRILAATFQDTIPETTKMMQLWLPLAVSDNMRNSRRGDFLNVV